MPFDDKDKLVILLAFSESPQHPRMGDLCALGKEFSACLLMYNVRRTWRPTLTGCVWIRFGHHLPITGTEVVVLNSLSAANELLDRRSLKYSSRYVDLPSLIALRVHFPIAISPQFVVVNDLMGWS